MEDEIAEAKKLVERLDVKIDDGIQQIDALDKKVDNGFLKVGKKIGALGKMMDAGFQDMKRDMNKGFDKVLDKGAKNTKLVTKGLLAKENKGMKNGINQLLEKFELKKFEEEVDDEVGDEIGMEVDIEHEVPDDDGSEVADDDGSDVSDDDGGEEGGDGGPDADDVGEDVPYGGPLFPE